MTRLVVDVSVAVKWYLPEVHADDARRLLEADLEPIVPELFFAEFGNVLWKRWRRGELAGDSVADVLEALDAIPFEVRPMRVLLPSAVEIAMDHRCTVYDGMYLALAVNEQSRMITADRRFHRAVAQGPLGRHILWVEENP